MERICNVLWDQNHWVWPKSKPINWTKAAIRADLGASIQMNLVDERVVSSMFKLTVPLLRDCFVTIADFIIHLLLL